MTIRVAVLGSGGRMGRAICAGVERATDLELVARIDHDDSIRDAVTNSAQVAIDFTTPDAVMGNVEQCLDAGLHVVVGTSGFDSDRLDRLHALADSHPGLGVVVAPNFALGAVLLMSFAAQAAPHFESVEVIELHHPDKTDAPSGTAQHTAHQVADAREYAQRDPSPDATLSSLQGARGADVEGVRVHSVRLRGLVAHEEVLLGNPGEVLTLRHDSLDRESFLPGVLLAVRRVVTRPGLTVGLASLLGLPEP